MVAKLKCDAGMLCGCMTLAGICQSQSIIIIKTVKNNMICIICLENRGFAVHKWNGKNRNLTHTRTHAHTQQKVHERCKPKHINIQNRTQKTQTMKRMLCICMYVQHIVQVYEIRI